MRSQVEICESEGAALNRSQSSRVKVDERHDRCHGVARTLKLALTHDAWLERSVLVARRALHCVRATDKNRTVAALFETRQVLGRPCFVKENGHLGVGTCLPFVKDIFEAVENDPSSSVASGLCCSKIGIGDEDASATRNEVFCIIQWDCRSQETRLGPLKPTIHL